MKERERAVPDGNKRLKERDNALQMLDTCIKGSENRTRTEADALAKKCVCVCVLLRIIQLHMSQDQQHIPTKSFLNAHPLIVY